MATIVEMPKLTDTMEEGVLVRWAKKVGEKVEPGDVLAEIETDKATMEYEAVDRGVLLKTLVPEGASVRPGTAIAVIGREGEAVEATTQAPASGATAKAAPNAPPIPAATPEPEAKPAPGPRRAASPLARKLAREAGVSLESVTGAGPGGRVTRRDIEAAIARAKPAAPSPRAPATPRPPPDGESLPLSQMRKAIARRMAEAKPGVPHFYLTRAVDAEALKELRERLVRDVPDAKVSYNDLVVRACALALRDHPDVNASFMGDAITRHGRVDVGIAVAIEGGLVTPVVRGADGKSVVEIAREVRDLAERARQKKLRPDAMQGATFSVSNLGMFGVDAFAAIIAPPEAAILAVGAVARRPVVKGEAVVPGWQMTLTLSCDHRAVDGATGARFLAAACDLLEHPLRLML
ncbi:MAG: dihydrolipoamide acetyltransferase family protein [Myxococcota bacterium]